MENFLREIGEKAVASARKQGVEVEAFLLHDRELSIEVVNGQVETLKEAEEIGMGLRVINRGRLGFAYTSDLSDAAVNEVVDDAISISKYTAADKHNILPPAVSCYPDINTFDNNIPATCLEDKIEMARKVEQVAKSTDKRITIIERAGYEETEYSSLIINSNGLYAYEKGNFSGIYIFLVAEEKADAQNGFSVMLKKRIKELEPELVGEEAARKAIRSFNARTINSDRLPCIMEPYVVAGFMGMLAQMVNAEAVQKGKSLFADKRGQMVASEVFSLVDDGTYENGIGSFPFDGEGVPARKNIVIENGILQGFLYDTYTASKAGVQSTGNGQRGSFRGLPSVGTTNFIIQPGKESPEKLINGLDKGFYITEVMGMHTANPISGDFSVGASGIMIENGQLSYPVRGVTIAGNMIQFFKDIETVGNDLRFYGSKAAPTIRLKSLSIGGE